MEQHPLDVWNLVANCAVAAGTLLAVLAALFGDWFRGRLFPPFLTVNLPTTRGVKQKFLLASDQGTRIEDGRVHRVRITNGRRWSPARDVQLLLLKVECPDAAGIYRDEWLGSIPLGWMGEDAGKRTQTIGPATDGNLCSVIKGKWLELYPLVLPVGFTAQYRDKCNIRVTLQAKGELVDSPAFKVEIVWNGQWSDDTEEMSRHLVVKEVPFATSIAGY